MSMSTIYVLGYRLLNSVQVDPKKFGANLTKLEKEATDNDPDNKGLRLSYDLEGSSLDKFDLEGLSIEEISDYDILKPLMRFDLNMGPAAYTDEDSYFGCAWLGVEEFLRPVKKSLLPGQTALFTICVVSFLDDAAVTNGLVCIRDGKLNLFNPSDVLDKVIGNSETDRFADWLLEHVSPVEEL